MTTLVAPFKVAIATALETPVVVAAGVKPVVAVIAVVVGNNRR